MDTGKQDDGKRNGGYVPHTQGKEQHYADRTQAPPLD